MDIQYYGLCLAAFMAPFIPMRVGYFMAERSGDVACLLSAGRRKTVNNNIERLEDPERTTRKSRPQTRRVFRNAAKNYFDITKLSRMNLDNRDGKVTIKGMQHLTWAVESGKGVIMATAHLGNFDYCAHVLASRGIEMLILVETFKDIPFLRKMVALRQRHGIRFLAVDMGGIKEALKTLRRGGTVLIVFDRDIQGNGINVNFLGRPTAFPIGVVDLALRTGASIVPIFSLRGASNTTSVFIEPPLILSNVENHDQALKENLERLVGILEVYLRTYPEQWVVMEPD